MGRYQIWDKTSPVITPVGEYLMPEQWIERYPAAAAIKYVVAGGEVNGAFCNPFSSMVEHYAQHGMNFSACVTDQDCLDAIEAFEDMADAPSAVPSTEERTAAALEFIAMSSLPDETV